MQKKEVNFNFLNKTTLIIVAIALLFLSAVVLLWQGNKNSVQSIPTTPAQVYFAGEYCIGNGEWQEIVSGEHISSTKGDVILRGNFHWKTPSGEYIGIFKGNTPIAFYTDHINLTFIQNDRSYTIDHENPKIGESACGVNYTAHSFSGEEVIEIIVHNPHDFGNENAIDEMLSNLEFWAKGVNIEFEKGVLSRGETQRNVGLLFMICSFVFLGTAMFSTLIHLKNSKIMWLLGLVIFFAGLYITYCSVGVCFWKESVILNTIILGVSKMLYMFFLSMLIVSMLKKTKKLGIIATIILGSVITLLFVLSLATKIFFYDTLVYWVIAQTAVNMVLFTCLVLELMGSSIKEKIIYVCAFLPLISFSADALATWLGAWEGGIISAYIFVILFIVAMIVLLRIIPSSINALAKSKELENEKLVLKAQLTESRVSTMMSQIRPHFIYNTLGSIEQLCELDPPKAGELVHDFAKYLRGNFGELDNPKPILMSKEMEHVHHYINIENVRFPDMTFTFEMNSNDFYIPALTIQPIVENAIKHGLMKLSKGGTIKVISYETEESYHVLVEDNGVGFDTSVLVDEREHVGIRNIRARLEAMVNGRLEIESAIGKGTKVLITISKGVTK